MVAIDAIQALQAREIAFDNHDAAVVVVLAVMGIVGWGR
jgi:hypothetical protein